MRSIATQVFFQLLGFTFFIHSRIQNVFQASVASVERLRDCTYIILKFNDEKLDEVFLTRGALYGEALHQRLDVLLDEYRDETLERQISVIIYDREGARYEEEIRLDVV